MAPSDKKKKENLLDGAAGPPTRAPPVDSPPAASGTALQTGAGVMGNVVEWNDFALFGCF